MQKIQRNTQKCKFGSGTQKWPKKGSIAICSKFFAGFGTFWLVPGNPHVQAVQNMCQNTVGLICKPDLTLRHTNRKLCMIYISIYICFAWDLCSHKIFHCANVGEIFWRIRLMPHRYWVNKFTGERVYEDPTKNKRSLEQKNQVI